MPKFNFNCNAGDIYNPQWSTMKSLSVSEDGSGGVLFVETASGGFVLKASSIIAQETFAAKLAAKLNVYHSTIRVVNYTGKTGLEWVEIKRK